MGGEGNGGLVFQPEQAACAKALGHEGTWPISGQGVVRGYASRIKLWEMGQPRLYGSLRAMVRSPSLF